MHAEGTGAADPLCLGGAGGSALPGAVLCCPAGFGVLPSASRASERHGENAVVVGASAPLSGQGSKTKRWLPTQRHLGRASLGSCCGHDWCSRG